MKMMQLVLVAGAIVATTAARAHADDVVVASATTQPGAFTQPAHVDSAMIPFNCAPYFGVPADSSSDLLAWDQRLSLAACEQDASIEAPLTDDSERLRTIVAELADAARTPIAIYHDAQANGPTKIRMMAAYGLGMTYVNIIVRARLAIPSSADTSYALHKELETILAGYTQDAITAFADVDRMATASPDAAAADTMMQTIVASARSLRDELTGT